MQPSRLYESTTTAGSSRASTDAEAPGDARADAGAAECEVDTECVVRATRPDCESPTEYRAMSVKEERATRLDTTLIAEDGGWCPRYVDPTARVALCEAHRCVLRDAESALAWASAIVPGLAALEQAPDVAIQRAPWFKIGGHVVVDVHSDWRIPSFDSTMCHAIDFVGDEEGLHASLRFESDRPASPGSTHDEVWLRDKATHDDGDDLDKFHVSVADDTGLAYEQVAFDLEPHCNWRVVEREGCEPSSCRVCQIDLGKRSRTPNTGMHSMRASPVRVSDPSCGPCLPDPNEALVPRIAAIVRGRTYSERWEGSGLRFFRHKTDCEAEVRAKRGQ